MNPILFCRVGRIKTCIACLACIYTVLTTALLLFMFAKQNETSPWQLDIGAKSRRSWINDPLRYIFPKDSQVTTTIPYLDDDSPEQSDEGAVNETAGSTVLVPTVNSSIIPGYFLLDSDQPFARRCRRCSLVSSSGHLHESGAGVDIDMADCVLRMNTAPVTGWEEDVGVRTDVRIIGHVNLPRGLKREESLRSEILDLARTRARYIVVPWLYSEKINMTTHSIVNLARSFKKNYPHVDFVFQTKEKYDELEERFKFETGHSRSEINTWFSTGFVSMLFALDVCEDVRVYGLANLDFCKQHPKSHVPYHYYEPTKRTECSYILKNEDTLSHGHRFLTERAMMSRWSLIYNITFHYPSWKATIANTTAQIADTPYFHRYADALKNGQKPKAPEYIFKNGKRYRVIRKRVRRKPKPPAVAAADKEDTPDKAKGDAQERAKVDTPDKVDTQDKIDTPDKVDTPHKHDKEDPELPLVDKADKSDRTKETADAVQDKSQVKKRIVRRVVKKHRIVPKGK